MLNSYEIFNNRTRNGQLYLYPFLLKKIPFHTTNIPTDIQFLIFQTALLLFRHLSLPT